MKKIAFFGICGKMGMAISKELLNESDVKIVAGFDVINTGEDIGMFLSGKKNGCRIYNTYESVLEQEPDMIIDFTAAPAVLKTINWAIENSIDIIVGTTGFKENDLEEIKDKIKNSSSKILIVPNFSIGAVLMMKISAMVAEYFDNCEIIEKHHDNKKDAPSGTSVSTAEQIGNKIIFNKSKFKEEEKENFQGSRGAFIKGIHIHSIRLPGLLAHQENIFGARGQTLTIKHDSIDRTSFYPGVILAIRNMDKLDNYTFGLEKLIKL